MKSTGYRNGNLFCFNCGGELDLNCPIPMDEATKKMKEFDILHENCKKTWTEPEVNQANTIYHKAMWWIANGERGMSSETMWHCFMGNQKIKVSHPYDPDDFKRCYKLLVAVPEWKDDLYKLKRLSPVWEKLVNNWDKLTEMIEDQLNKLKAGENAANGMYEFMKTLIE